MEDLMGIGRTLRLEQSMLYLAIDKTLHQCRRTACWTLIEGSPRNNLWRWRRRRQTRHPRHRTILLLRGCMAVQLHAQLGPCPCFVLSSTTCCMTSFVDVLPVRHITSPCLRMRRSSISSLWLNKLCNNSRTCGSAKPSTAATISPSFCADKLVPDCTPLTPVTNDCGNDDDDDGDGC